MAVVLTTLTLFWRSCMHSPGALVAAAGRVRRAAGSPRRRGPGSARCGPGRAAPRCCVAAVSQRNLRPISCWPAGPAAGRCRRHRARRPALARCSRYWPTGRCGTAQESRATRAARKSVGWHRAARRRYHLLPVHPRHHAEHGIFEAIPLAAHDQAPPSERPGVASVPAIRPRRPGRHAARQARLPARSRDFGAARASRLASRLLRCLT